MPPEALNPIPINSSSIYFTNRRLPYNWKTPTTYLFTMVIQYAATFYLGAIFVCFILFFGLCEVLNALKKDLSQQLIFIQNEIQSEIWLKNSRKPWVIAAQRLKKLILKQRFCEFIQFHSQVLQLRLNFPDKLLYPWNLGIKKWFRFFFCLVLRT